MVSAAGPQWRGAQAQWLYKCGCRLLLMNLITPSDVSLGVHRSILTETYPLVTTPVSTRWSPPGVLSGAVLMISGSLLSALTQSLLAVAIGDFDGLFCGSALLGLKSLPRPTPAFLGVGPLDFWLPLALFPVPEVFVAGLCSCLLVVLGVFPSP